MLSNFFMLDLDRGMFKHVQVDSSSCKMNCSLTSTVESCDGVLIQIILIGGIELLHVYL